MTNRSSRPACAQSQISRLRSWLLLSLLPPLLVQLCEALPANEDAPTSGYDEDPVHGLKDLYQMQHRGDEKEDAAQEGPCVGGSCPMPDDMETEQVKKAEKPDDKATGGRKRGHYSCGYWMGPSPIKQHEEHGFGLGLFTGNFINKGDQVDPAIFIPIYDWDDSEHPPFREYVWDGEVLPHLTLTSHSGMFMYMPGIAAFAPCTSSNYNVELAHHVEESNDPYELQDQDFQEWMQNPLPPTAGSFSPYSSFMYRATRTIVPGEELVVQCSDANFDGGNYFLSHFQPEKDDVMCLDRYLHVRSSYHPRVGQGLFAKVHVDAGTVLLSSPLAPIDRKDIKMPDTIPHKVPDHQLLLNYCLGHPDSDLLFLPTGPLINYLNHGDPDDANAKIVWHTPIYDHDDLHHRNRHHHEELFQMSAQQVVKIHGKTLLIDIVTTKDIRLGDEILIDYGEAWRAAWKSHVSSWNWRPPMDQMSARQYSEFQDTAILRTSKEQLYDPYPNNLMFVCSFSEEWEDPPPEVEEIEHNWLKWETHNCFLPCVIENRYVEPVQWNPNDVDGDGQPIFEDTMLYTVYMLSVDHNPDVEWKCQLMPNVEYTLSRIPRFAITIVDRPYSTHTFLPKVFRHEIGVPEGLYPETWITKKTTRGLRTSKGPDKDGAAEEDKSLVVVTEQMEQYKRRATRPKLETKRRDAGA